MVSEQLLVQQRGLLSVQQRGLPLLLLQGQVSSAFASLTVSTDDDALTVAASVQQREVLDLLLEVLVVVVVLLLEVLVRVLLLEVLLLEVRLLVVALSYGEKSTVC